MSGSKHQVNRKNILHPLISLLGLLALYSCESVKDGSTSPLSAHREHFTIDSILMEVSPSSEQEFLQFKYPLDSTEAIFILKDSSLVHRQGDTLVLKLQNGSQSAWVNRHEDEDEDYVDYEYMGKLPAIGHFILNASYSEWRNYIVVDVVNGDTTFLCGYPEISPDRTLLIAGNSDLFSGFSFNGIQLFSIKNKVLHEVGEKELEWGAEDLYWADESSIVIKRNLYDSSLVELQTTDYVKLLLTRPKK